MIITLRPFPSNSMTSRTGFETGSLIVQTSRGFVILITGSDELVEWR